MAKEISNKLYSIDEKLAWFKLADNGLSVKEITLKFNISRKTYYKWYKRFLTSGKEGLDNLPPVPKRKNKKFTPENVLLVFRTYEDTGFGPRKLSKYLFDNHLLKISPAYISTILRKPKPLTYNSSGYQETSEYLTQDRKDANLDLIINRLPL